jgi:hypothetical protein
MEELWDFLGLIGVIAAGGVIFGAIVDALYAIRKKKPGK